MPTLLELTFSWGEVQTGNEQNTASSGGDKCTGEKEQETEGGNPGLQVDCKL